MQALAFATPPATTETAEALRQEVRDFLSEELRDRSPQSRAESWSGYDPAFSRKMARRGWVGMTLPKKYGGHERSPLAPPSATTGSPTAKAAPTSCATAPKPSAS